jgi:tetratricopeptide (TPR) repeat protein
VLSYAFTVFSTAQSATQSGFRNAAPGVAYVGSKVCAECHRGISERYSRTGMGRSIYPANAAGLAGVPLPATVYDQRLDRHFEVHFAGADLYQSEYQTEPGGKELFRDSHKVEWIIGSGSHGFGAIIRRRDYLFEAPLSFYSRDHRWALSPGYQLGDFGFSRPILPGCITCHSGRPQPLLNQNGRFGDPPFSELAIGCENCHGPGELHVRDRRSGAALEAGADSSIVNPAKLPGWLADNLCMSCHQTGDARVLMAGKDYRDFRPGTPLAATLAVLLAPPKPGAPSDSDLLEHYFSMVLSRCYQSSGKRLGCLKCHDPHLEPSAEEAPAYYRQKCLVCHTEKSCTLPLEVRRHNSPPDDCARCHMPKRDVKEITHAALTNHRIPKRPGEPYPDWAFHLATAKLPDLIYLDAVSGEQGPDLPALTRLEAYGQLLATHPEYREPYLTLANKLEPTDPDDLKVLEALARRGLMQGDAAGLKSAIQSLDKAVERGSTSPADFQQLATLLIQSRRLPEAVEILERGIKLIPYDPGLYRLLVKANLALGRTNEASAGLDRGLTIFPQDPALRQFLEEAGESARHRP